jgi:DNA-binding IclR family transcriptional regulator
MAEVVGLSTMIVNMLKEYAPRPVPVGLIAKLLGRQPGEIREFLDGLAQQGVIHVQDEDVSLKQHR